MSYLKNVLVTGANGFTGRFVCKELKKRDIPFLAILRPNSDSSWMERSSINYKFADLNDPKQLSKVMKGCTSLLNIASIGFGSAPSIIKACEMTGIDRAVFISTTSIYTKLNSRSKLIRLSAEETIKSSKVIWTIIRPTMIYGTENDRNMIKLIKWIDKVRFLPIFGNGRSLQQPIFVKDLSWSVVEVLDKRSAYYKSFNLSGKNPLTFLEVIQDIEESLNKKAIKLFFPAKLIVFFLSITEKMRFNLPIKAEQIQRLNENKDFNHDDATKLFKFLPTSFKDGIDFEVRKYQKKRNKLSLRFKSFLFKLK